MSGEVVARLRAAGCVFAEDEGAILIEAAAAPAELAVMVERRVSGEPIEQIVGWAEFCGLRIAIEPGVFVPRRRTEFLVDQTVALLPPKAVVLDLCCGAGAIGAALLAQSPNISLHSADVDAVAVACARRNLETPVYEGDLYEPLPLTLKGNIDVIVQRALCAERRDRADARRSARA